jgi:hypothetical protein
MMTAAHDDDDHDCDDAHDTKNCKADNSPWWEGPWLKIMMTVADDDDADLD